MSLLLINVGQDGGLYLFRLMRQTLTRSRRPFLFCRAFLGWSYGRISRSRLELPVLVCLFGELFSTCASAEPVRSGQMQSGEVSMIRVAARNHGLQDFQLVSRTGPSGRLVVDGFTAVLGGGQISGSGHVDFANSPGPHRMTVQLRDVDAMAFLKLLEVQLDAVIQARITGSFDLRWRGTRGPEVRRSLSGTAQWTATPGYAAEADVMKMAASLTGIPQLLRFDFSEAGAHGVFREGVLEVKRLRVAGPDQEVSGTGTLDVASSQVRMTLTMRISPELVGKSARHELRTLATIARGARKMAEKKGEKRDRLVSLPMPLQMTGELQDPRFRFGEWPGQNSGGTPAATPEVSSRRSQH